jgi:ribonucleoside-diphosphate reductase alpha chain
MIQVIKRNGKQEALDVDKIHLVLEWACEGLDNVFVSEIEMASHIQFYDNIRTKDIHETMIKSAAELISAEAPDYQYVAARLINYQLRKEVYGDYHVPNLKDQVERVVEMGYYDTLLLKKYSDRDWEILGEYIDHARDYNIAFAGMEQLRGKYLVKNRATGEIFETPQMAFMLIAMTLFSSYKKDRLIWVKRLYDAISSFQLSLPTPIMAGARTPQRQFSSCVLIETDDSLDSINASSSAIVKYVSQKAGIGIGAGAIRAELSPIRNGDAAHTGVIPFYRHFQTAVKSCSQGGVRGGAATLHYPIWHLEVENLLVLKNNKGTEDNRVRHLDYSVQFNKLMYERLISGGNITLFSPSDVEGLYEAFFSDQEKFRELYEAAEQDPNIRKKTVSALQLFSDFMKERKDTGRVYFMNVDHCNTHSSFITKYAPIRMSNLCQEITLPTKPIDNIWDDNGEIALCILAAINWGLIEKPEDFEMPCTLAVRALNALIDSQEYPVLAAEIATMTRRPIGIGIINFAYWMAKNGTGYVNPDLDLVHEYAEAWSYYLIKASANLAEEHGACPKSHETKYEYGIVPIDTYKKEMDELVAPNYYMDWDSLREQLIDVGIYNSTLMALMPSETSSQISNATNGIEPPRNLVSVKQSRDGVLKQVVPDVINLGEDYTLLWDLPDPRGYLSICAVLQKFIDQSISTNTSYNPKFYPDEQLSMNLLLQDMLFCYKYGIKTGYYFNTLDGAGEIEVADTPDEDDDDECEACVI